jgi:hypothetical protein
MATIEDVEHFLREFRQSWGPEYYVVIRQDESDEDALSILGITPEHRKEEIIALNYANYMAGPLSDESGKSGDIWEFGKYIRRYPVYIKLKIWTQNNGQRRGKCISFHIAQYKLAFPLAKK